MDLEMMHTPINVVLEEDKHWWFASRTRAILGYLDRYICLLYTSDAADE